MKIGILSKRTNMLAGKLKEFFENRGNEVTIYTDKNLILNENLFQNDFFILKSKKLFYLYAAFYLEANNIPIFPNPELTFRHKNRIEAHFMIKQAGLTAPDYYFGTFETLRKNKDKLNFPLLLKPIMSSGSRGIKIIKSLEDLPKDANQLIYLEEYLNGTHYDVYFIKDEICQLEKPPLSNEHVDMNKVALSDDVKEIIIKWKNTFNIPFGHLDMVREENTEKLYVVDPGNFPEFTNWKREGDFIVKIGNIILEQYNQLKV